MLIYDWEADRDNGIKIRADRHKAQDQDFADALTASIAKDGQTVPTANLPMGGFKHTGVAAATLATDYARADQIQSAALTFFESAGTGSAYTLTPVPAIGALAAGQAWDVVFHTTNVGTTPTLQVSGLTAKTIVNADGTALSNGAITAGGIKRVQYDGTNFQIVGGTTSSVFGLVYGGLKTTDFSAASNTAYDVDCTTVSITTTGPGSPQVGDTIMLAKFGTNALTFALNGLKYYGGTVDPSGSAEGVTILRYTGTARGWIDQ